jgi:hypothetical protein
MKKATNSSSTKQNELQRNEGAARIVKAVRIPTISSFAFIRGDSRASSVLRFPQAVTNTQAAFPIGG